MTKCLQKNHDWHNYSHLCWIIVFLFLLCDISKVTWSSIRQFRQLKIWMKRKHPLYILLVTWIMYGTLAFLVFSFGDHFQKISLNLQLENSKFFQQCENSHEKIFRLVLNDNASLLSMLSSIVGWVMLALFNLSCH